MIKIDNYIQKTNQKSYTIPARPAGNFRVFPQLTTDYFVKQGEKSFPAMADNLKNGKNAEGKIIEVLGNVNELPSIV